MLYEFEGQVSQIFDEASGTSRSSGKTWRRKNFIVMVHEKKYGKPADIPKYITAWNKSCDKIIPAVIHQDCIVTVLVESREYNGRWTTDLSLEDITFPGAFGDTLSAHESEFPDQDPDEEPGEKDDLPF